MLYVVLNSSEKIVQYCCVFLFRIAVELWYPYRICLPFVLQYVEAKFDFEPQDSDELGFRRKDRIKVLEQSNDNWWKGEINGRVGVFPATYVEPIENTDQQWY